MKDAYSFDRSQEAALRSYQAMFAAYHAILTRMGLQFRAVAADTGAIGGSASHEFQVIAQTGEDAIAYCPDSDYAANVELSEAVAPTAQRGAPGAACTVVATPRLTRCEDVAAHLGLPVTQVLKTLVVAVDALEPVKDGDDLGVPRRVVATTLCAVLLRGDHVLNDIKLGKVPGLAGFRLATEAEIVQQFGCPAGFLGPVGMAGRMRIVADRSVLPLSDFVCGANQVDAHYTGVNWGRDLPEPGSAEIAVADVRNVVAGDPSPDGRGVLAIERGIEVGHVFYLGTKYSAAMEAVFVDEDGQSKPIEMGCYGIGVTRLPAAAIEQHHDERGIVWPRAIAPFDLVITPLGYHRSEAVRSAAQALYDQCLQAGMDVVLDDRDERPGAMFADWELIGIPLRVTVGERGLKEGVFELTVRRGLATKPVPCADVMAALKDVWDAC